MMADTDHEVNNQPIQTSEPNSKGVEAEDIVADAIKLNVDEDLNEHDNTTEKSSNFPNGNQTQNSLDNVTIEDEPNYEIDENDEAQYLKEQNLDDKQQTIEESNEPNENTISKEQTSTKNEDQTVETVDNGTAGEIKDDTEKAKDGKSNESKTNESSQKDEKTSKESGGKKESSTVTQSASKSKSSSSKDKDKDKDKDHDKSSDRKSSSSNNKIVWVSGLSTSAKASDLQALFKKHGKVVSAKIIKNTKLSGSKLFGVITMESVEQAEKCIKNLNKTEFDGKTITVEKNRLEEKKASDSKGDHKERKDGEKSNKRDRSRSRSKSPKRRSYSPVRRFPLHNSRPGYLPLRRGPPFGSFRGGRGGFGPPPRAPFMTSGPPPVAIRKFEVERLMRRREIREKERRREEDDYRRQKDLERRQMEERDKLEREKMRLKIERERLEREKAEFLRAERDKARMERERLEREREELRRKQQQLPLSSSRLDERSSKRGYDDLYGGSSSAWELDRKRGSSFSAAGNSSVPLSASARYEDLDPGLGGNGFSNFSTYSLLGSSADLIDRRKLDVPISAQSSSLRDSNRSSSGYDRDDRRQIANGLAYSSSRSSLSTRDRRDRDDWKGGVESRRTESRFVDSKNPLTQTAPQSQSSYLSSAARGNYDRAPDAWSSAPDRMPPASSLGKFSSYASVSAIADRNRVAPSLSQSVMSSTIGMYNSAAPMSGLISNPNYNSSLNSGHRRY